MSDIAGSGPEGLEAHLRRNLDDWDSWLVYADWLLEQDDVRGQIITLSHRLATAELSLEERQLLQTNIAVLEAPRFEWLSGYKELKKTSYTWQYGFVIGVTLPRAKTALKKLEQLCAHPTARFLVSVGLCFNVIGAEGARSLAQAEHLRRFTLLDLNNNRIGDEGARALAQSENLCGLAQLYLSSNHIGEEGARALAQSEHLRSLVRLHLFHNPVGAAGEAALKQSAALRNCQVHL